MGEDQADICNELVRNNFLQEDQTGSGTTIAQMLTYHPTLLSIS